MPEPTEKKLVLCGPILRKVTTSSVAVFLALREPKLIELRLQVSADPDSDILHSHNTLSQPLAATIPLGVQLHVALVQLSLPVSSGLSPGHLYAYNLIFRDPENPNAAGIDLRDDAIQLVGDFTHHIGCNQGKLPAFSLSPQDFNQFNLIHGSCRKPHGEGKDMLANLDDLLSRPYYRSDADKAPTNISQYEDPLHRPHLLLLTGDQIYTDDVSPPLLRALHDAAHELLGWREEFQNTAMPGGFAPKVKSLHQLIKDKNQALQEILNTTSEAAINDKYEEIKTNLGAIYDKVEETIQAFPETWDFDPFIIGYHDMAENLDEFKANYTTWENINRDNPGFMWQFIQDYLQRRTELVGHLDFFLNLASDRHWGQIEVTSEPITPDPEFIVSDSDKRWAAYHQLPKQDLILSRISPPQRAQELKEFAAMTSDAMEAHLLFLGEFYMMYLFSWSDEPWPKDEDGKLTLPYYWESVPNYSLFGDLSKFKLIDIRKKTLEFAAGLWKVRRVMANIPTLMIFDDHEVTDDWNLNEEWVLNVNKWDAAPEKRGCGPHLLRNALAAYAVFQDWGNHPEDYETGQAGSLILDHLRYEDKANPGHTSADNEEHQDLRPNIVTPEGYSNEVLFDVFGLGEHTYDIDSFRAHTEEILDQQLMAGNRKKWHWTYDPYANTDQSFFKLIALDTRTWRQFPSTAWNLQYQHLLKEGFELQKDAYIGRKGPANLIYSRALDQQLTELSDHLLNLVISPAPVFGLPLLEDGLQRLSAMNGSVEAADYEAWQGNHLGFRVFKEKLAHKKVVLLSGDVHYAYTNYLKFFDENGQEETTAMAQLCSSSMKNETVMTEALGSAGRAGNFREWLSKPFNLSAVEWGKAIPTFTDAIQSMQDSLDNVGNFGKWFFETAPIMPWNDQARIKYYLDYKDYSLFNFEMLLPDGLWQMGSGVAAFVGRDFFFGNLEGIYDRSESKTSYRILFMKDYSTLENDKDEKRLDYLGQLNNQPQAAIKAEELEGHWDEMREVIGFNNIARVFFHAEPDDVLSAKSLDHYFYWQLHQWGETLDHLSYTLHEVPLKTGPSTWQNFKKELVRLALKEYQWWNPSESNKISETVNGQRSPKARARLEYYYTVAGLGSEFSALETEEDLVWGAVFLAYLMKLAQAGAEFPSSQRIIDFMRAAKANRIGKNLENRFWLYDLQEIRPEAGDLLCNWRNEAFTYAAIDPAATHFRAAQCCVIVSISAEGQLRAIGGNLSDRVDDLYLDLDSEGFIPTGPATEKYNAILRVRTAKTDPDNSSTPN